jgi:elongation factor G
MKHDNISIIRNIGIISHIDAGKTTVTERILYYTGVSHKIGEVHFGEAIMDWMPQEKERGISITAAATSCRWKNHIINIIDTPGHVDFTIEVERSLRILDGAVAIFCGVEGVEPQSEAVWYQSDKYMVPRISFVNKMDRVGADFFKVFKEMGEKFHTKKIIPIQIPIGKENSFRGVVDIISMRAYEWNEEDLGFTYFEVDIPKNLKNMVEEYRNSLIERLAEIDDELMELYINEKGIEEYDIKSALRRKVLTGEAVPLLLGSGLKNKGVQLLLDAIVDYLPSPLDIKPVEGLNPITGEQEERKSLEKAPFSALAFKIMNYEGRRLTYIRIYSGTISDGDPVYNPRRREKERIARLFRMHANRKERVNKGKAGDILAVTGLKNATTGDTLCDESNPITFEPIEFPEPVISIAVEPKRISDMDKLNQSLEKLSWEDPTVRIKEDEETGQTIISGMGELHLDVFVKRLYEDFGLEVKVGKPQVVYRETIKEKVKSEGKFFKEIEGKKHHGHLFLELEPKDKGFEFINSLTINIPNEFVAAVEDGVRDSLSSGVMGYPVIDISVNFIDAEYIEGESTELGFRISASMAFIDGLRKGKPVLLEPMMEIEVMTPEEYIGHIIGDLNSKGKIEGITDKGITKVIKGIVPLSKMFGYSTLLRSMSKGRGTYSMRFSHYDRAEDN